MSLLKKTANESNFKSWKTAYSAYKQYLKIMIMKGKTNFAIEPDNIPKDKNMNSGDWQTPTYKYPPPKRFDFDAFSVKTESVNLILKILHKYGLKVRIATEMIYLNRKWNCIALTGVNQNWRFWVAEDWKKKRFSKIFFDSKAMEELMIEGSVGSQIF